MRAMNKQPGLRMIPLRSSEITSSSDLISNQTSNGIYGVRPKISAEICRGAEV